MNTVTEVRKSSKVQRIIIKGKEFLVEYQASRKLIEGRLYWMVCSGHNYKYRGYEGEIVKFIKEYMTEETEKEVAEKRRVLMGRYDESEKIIHKQEEYEFEAYLFMKRWSIGSGAEPISMYLVITPEEEVINILIEDIDRTERHITNKENRIEELKRELDDTLFQNKELRRILKNKLSKQSRCNLCIKKDSCIHKNDDTYCY